MSWGLGLGVIFQEIWRCYFSRVFAFRSGTESNPLNRGLEPSCDIFYIESFLSGLVLRAIELSALCFNSYMLVCLASNCEIPEVNFVVEFI
jgi:hypothetical protein